MIELNENRYNIVFEPLRQVDFNTLFIRSVLVGDAGGKIFVDAVDEPKSYYIVHDCGMSLLFGAADNEQFNQELSDYFLQKNEPRKKDEWLQAFPRDWDVYLEKFTNSGKAIRYNRLNFSFDKAEYEKNNSQILPAGYSVVRTTPDIYSSVRGAVIPQAYWRDQDLLFNKCVSFTVMMDQEPASTAFTANLHDDMLELGIETQEKYRGKGLARIACMALINYCLEKSLEPIWTCRLENTASANLAKRLGFRETMRAPYYHIPV